MKSLLNNISFKTDDGKLTEMFLTKAEAIGEKLDIKITQYRKFYEKVLELNEKSKSLEDEDFKIKVLPFLKMLVSKVVYAKKRGNCGDNFEILMKESIKKVNSKEELVNFKYFLEAIIGYMPKK